MRESAKANGDMIKVEMNQVGISRVDIEEMAATTMGVDDDGYVIPLLETGNC